MNKAIYYICCLLAFLILSGMSSCDEDGPDIILHNMSGETISAKCHIDYSDSRPNSTIEPGVKYVIGVFDECRVVYISIYKYQPSESNPGQSGRPGANNPALPEDLKLLKRYTLSQRALENRNWTITYYGETD